LCFRFRNTKVDDFDFALEAYHHVVGRHIAMDDVQRFRGRRVQTPMSMVKSGCDFFYAINNMLNAQRTIRSFNFVQNLFEVSPVDEIHHDEELIFLHTEFRDRNDV
jgi:hypothetical protein